MTSHAGGTHRVVVHDDADHSFEYVVELFVRALRISPRDAFALAAQIHEMGSAEIARGTRAQAEDLRARLFDAGPDRRLARSRASLAVSIEELSAEGAVLSFARGRACARGYEALEDAALAALHQDSVDRSGHVCTAGGVGEPLPWWACLVFLAPLLVIGTCVIILGLATQGG